MASDNDKLSEIDWVGQENVDIEEKGVTSVQTDQLN